MEVPTNHRLEDWFLAIVAAVEDIFQQRNSFLLVVDGHHYTTKFSETLVRKLAAPMTAAPNILGRFGATERMVVQASLSEVRVSLGDPRQMITIAETRLRFCWTQTLQSLQNEEIHNSLQIAYQQLALRPGDLDLYDRILAHPEVDLNEMARELNRELIVPARDLPVDYFPFRPQSPVLRTPSPEYDAESIPSPAPRSPSPEVQFEQQRVQSPEVDPELLNRRPTPYIDRERMFEESDSEEEQIIPPPRPSAIQALLRVIETTDEESDGVEFLEEVRPVHRRKRISRKPEPGAEEEDDESDTDYSPPSVAPVVNLSPRSVIIRQEPTESDGAPPAPPSSSSGPSAGTSTPPAPSVEPSQPQPSTSGLTAATEAEAVVSEPGTQRPGKRPRCFSPDSSINENLDSLNTLLKQNES